jgi:2-dehydropantoate 2-reductase
VAVLVKPARVDSLREGLAVTGLIEATATVEVVTAGREVGQVDYLILATKTADTASALESAAGVEVGAALSLQNGLAKDDALAQVFGAERVIGAACAVGAGLDAPGRARLTMNQATWVGEPGGGTSERVVRLAAVLRAAGFPAWSVTDIRAVEWYKLCMLLPGAFVTALSRRTYDEMALDEHLAPLWVRLLRETCAVANAEGITFTDPPGSPWRLGTWQHEPDDVVLEALRGIGERQRAAGEKMRPSMLQDVLAGRRTEAADLAGDLLARARRHGVAVPAAETCYALVRGLEEGLT